MYIRVDPSASKNSSTFFCIGWNGRLAFDKSERGWLLFHCERELGQWSEAIVLRRGIIVDALALMKSLVRGREMDRKTSLQFGSVA